MYLSIRKFSGATSRDEVFKSVKEGLVPLLQEFSGFVTYYAVDFGDGDLGAVSVYETKEEADEATIKGLSWVRENIPELLTNEPTILRGEVLFQAAAKGIGKTV
jgi:hypothetical protein